MNVAVFGSRSGVDLDAVSEYLEPRFDHQTVLVSGGAAGVDRHAETYWLGRGGRVLSYRPKKLSGGGEIADEYGVELWRLGPWPEGPSVSVLDYEPTWATYDGALTYRSMLVVEASDRGVAFMAQRSAGTGRTIWLFKCAEKPCVVKEVAHGTHQE